MPKQTMSFLRFTGQLHENLEFKRTPGWETERIARRPPLGDGHFVVALVDEQGGEICGVHPLVDFEQGCLESAGEPRVAEIESYVPLHLDGTKLVFRCGDRILHAEDIPKAPPRVSIKDVALADQTITVSWSAEHPEHHPMTFDVVYLADGRRGFRLARGLEQTRLCVSLGELPGSRNGRIAVMASDGIRSGFAVSNAFSVANKPATVWIQRPDEGEVLAPDQPVNLIGQAVDVAGGPLDEKGLVWFIDNESVTRGRRHTFAAALEPGAHEILLRYTSDDGSVAEAKARVKVAPPSKGQEQLRALLAEIEQEKDQRTGR